MDDPQQRGHKFESFLDQLFKASGMVSLKNAKSTFQEQIDLIVRWGNFLSLVEAKWEKNPVGIQTIQAFLTRLRRRGNMTVGIFIAINGFSDHAIKEAISTQGRSLILLDVSDILAVIKEKISLDGLLWKKMWLLQEREISFYNQWNKKEHQVLQTPIILFEHEKYRYSNGDTISYFQDQAIVQKRVAHPVIFTPVYLDCDFKVISFFIDKKKLTTKGLNIFIEQYNNLVGFNHLGSFCISQHKVNWVGFGIDSLIQNFKAQNSRYDNLDVKGLHHSEAFQYIEPFLLNYQHLFAFQIYSYVAKDEKDIQRYPLRDFTVKFFLDNESTTHSLERRIETLAMMSGFDSYEESNTLEYKKAGFSSEKIKIAELGKIDLLYNDWGNVEAVIFPNPCVKYPEIKMKVKSISPALLFQERWVGFVKDHFKKDKENDLELITIECGLDDSRGSLKQYVRIIVNW